jgi:Na+-transporting NADH:ubiquinone oxidoreductase subunit C
VGDNLKTIGFATAVCLVCSLLLAAVYSGLKAKQDRNREIDLKTNVLKAFGVEVVDEKGRSAMPAEEIESVFAESVKGVVLDSDSKITDLAVAALTPEHVNDRDKEKGGLKQYYPYYVFADAQTGRKRYAVHISGMGLWSVVKGYLALEDDLATVAGVAFYDHQETPGLGGEIDRADFQASFAGKLMLKEGVVQTFRVIKPSAPEGDSSVHGISGATMTCKGLTAFINSDFVVYNKHFETIRNK